MVEKDPWGGDSGLLTDYEGVITDAWFGTDPKYNNGETVLLMLKLETDSPEQREHEERYACGPDWKTFDGGETVEHPKGPQKRFNKASQVQKFVEAAIACDGAAEVLRGRGTPKEAKLWIGTKWFFEATEASGTLADGSKFSSVKNYPTKFLGAEGDIRTAGEADVEASSDRPSGPGSEGGPLAGLSEAQVTQVKVLAKTLPYSDWVEKVMEIEGVLSHDEFVAALVQETFYEGLKNGE